MVFAISVRPILFLLGKLGAQTHHFSNNNSSSPNLGARKESSKPVFGSLFDPLAFGKTSRILNLEHKDR